MDKLNQRLDKFYTDCYHVGIEDRCEEKNNFDDLNTSLDDHFKQFDSSFYELEGKEQED